MVKIITKYPDIKVKILNPLATMPKYAKPGDAGVDLCPMETVEIAPHGTVIVGTGIAVELPVGTYGAIVPRSGMASERGIRPANAPGTIDSGYRDEIKVALHNDSYETQVVEAGERVVQMIICEHLTGNFVPASELSETERGSGSFGSTGTGRL